jgi:hypothetical protein
MAAVLLLAAFPLFGRGKTEEEPAVPLNAEYVLLITAFDVSSLPPSQAALGSILQRELVRDLGRIHYRLRSDTERSRYEELAWTAAMHEAAANLAAKRSERDALLYQGLPNWKYKKELKRIKGELDVLEDEYDAAESERPLIDARPVFTISEVNTGAAAEQPEAAFPPSPERGGEEAFLRTHNADAFLSGKLTLVYGRIYAEFRLFTRGASFVYEDSTIFSPEDLIAAADELKLRFMAALANTSPARLVLHAEPENARILVNGRTVENGVELELAPGPVTISVQADNYHGIVKETELPGGEITEYSFVLKPLVMEKLELTLPENASVYMGALYTGGNTRDKAEEETETPGLPENAETPAVTESATAQGAAVESATAQSTELAEPTEAPAVDLAESGPPGELASEGSPPPADLAESIIRESPDEPGVFTLYVPQGQYRYVRVDTEDGLTGEAIILGSPQEDGEVRIVTLEPRKLPGRDDKPVEVKRRKFYGAYGRFWVTLPIAFFLHGLSKTYTDSYYSSASPNLYDKALNAYYVSTGAWIVAGVFLAESLIRMGIYIHSASKESVPLWE